MGPDQPGRDGVAGGAVPHVELSLTELPPVTQSGVAAPLTTQPSLAAAPETDPPPADPLARWVAAVVEAVEPCVVIDARARVVAMSPSCVRLLGLFSAPIGQPLHGGALQLVDFSSEAGSLTDDEVGKIPPLLSLNSGRLARGLIRAECEGSACTLDAIATPIGEPGVVVGSLTFFSPV